jgi:hypothetical protein
MSTTIIGSFLAIPAQQARSSPEVAAKLYKKIYGIPAVHIAFAGTSFLPFEQLTSLTALIATSFANCHLKQSIGDELGSFIHSNRFSDLQSHLLSLLCLMSLSAISGRLSCKS